MSESFTPPPPQAEARKAWNAGRRLGLNNRPSLPGAFEDRALQRVYERGWTHGIQEAIQRDHGDPPPGA